MHESGLYLKTVIEKARLMLDVSSAGKYTDDLIVRQLIPGQYDALWQYLSMNCDNPVRFRRTISLVAGTERYVIPPCIAAVVRFGKRDENGILTEDVMPRTEFDANQRGWSLEGNTIVLDPPPRVDEDWVVWYEPSGSYVPHTGAGNLTALDTMTLALEPTLGLLDKRPNAYVGQTIRVLHDSSWQEQIVDTHDVETGEVTFQTPLQDTGFTLPEQVIYEVAPPGWMALWQCMAHSVAMEMGGSLNISQAKMTYLEGLERKMKKGIADRLSNLMQRRAKHFESVTLNNPDYAFNLYA